MSGTWISQIQAALRKHFPASQDYRAEDFKREPMPVPVGHFLEHALTRRAATIQLAVDPDWFDLSDQALIESERRWREALIAAARYPAALWEQSIDQAVTHVVAFLVSPADSFCEFAYAGVDGDMHPRTILHRLAYFKPYSALREVVKGYLDRQEAEPVSREDLRAAILKADRSIVADYEPSDWIALLRPLFELASVSTVKGQSPQVPVTVLKQVFQSKAAHELVRRLEAIESIGGHRRLSESALLTAVGPTEIAKPVPEETPAPSESGQPRPIQLNDVHARASNAAIPRWMQFTSNVETSPSSRSGDGGPEVVQQSQNTAAGATTLTEAPETSRLGSRAPLPDDASPPSSKMVERRVLGPIDPSQRSRFVNSLFDGDHEHFSRVLALLDRAEDWESAAHVIGAEVFERNSVDIYSDPAVEFTNVVESRYQ